VINNVFAEFFEIMSRYLQNVLESVNLVCIVVVATKTAVGINQFYYFSTPYIRGYCTDYTRISA